MDPFDDLLKSIKMRHCRAGTLRLRAPWGLQVERTGLPVAYGLMEGGPCWISVPGMPPLELRSGDVALVTGQHVLQSSLEVPSTNLIEVLAGRGMPPCVPEFEYEEPVHFGWGGSGPETRMLGIVFGLTGGEHNPWIASLPGYIVLRGDSGQFPWMQAANAFLSVDHTDFPGYVSTARVLAELALVSILRAHLHSESQTLRGWLRGLAEPGIGKVLLALHERPGDDWTVGSMAQLAGRSRTNFATRFAELVGLAPIEYLTQWRMHLAAERIAGPGANLTQLAFELGYTSPTAFRNAFKRRYGVVPSRFAETGGNRREPTADPAHG